MQSVNICGMPKGELKEIRKIRNKMECKKNKQK